ncbi:HNH endonuclease [Microcoleus sp. Pol11C1]|uniref:HNH endonuclease n=1 Tax=unclassified Microcoleus TaxID=2642155 RepID=UPI002FCE6BB6
MDLNLVLTDDNRLLPASQVLIADADWRIQYLDRDKVNLLHPHVSQKLAAIAGSRSLLKDVTEQCRKIKQSQDKQAIEWCQQWQGSLRSPEVEEALKRLILDERGIEWSINLKWLAEISVKPANMIETSLFLDDDCIASEVPGHFYFHQDQETFYLRCDNKSTMRQYLIESLNQQLTKDDCKLGDRIRFLVTILDENLQEIKNFLNTQNVRTIQGEIPKVNFQNEEVFEPDSNDNFNFTDNGNDVQQEDWEENELPETELERNFIPIKQNNSNFHKSTAIVSNKSLLPTASATSKVESLRELSSNDSSTEQSMESLSTSSPSNSQHPISSPTLQLTNPREIGTQNKELIEDEDDELNDIYPDDLEEFIPSTHNFSDAAITRNDRKTTNVDVPLRPEQRDFRERLLSVYNKKCAITGYEEVGAANLEAAHISSGLKSYHVSNGLLLRADIHILFDKYLITINTLTKEVCVASKLSDTEYSKLSGRKLLLPKDKQSRPSKQVLEWHNKQCSWFSQC